MKRGEAALLRGGREMDFAVDRGASRGKAPWAGMLLIAGAAGAAFALSHREGFLLGQMAAAALGLCGLHGLWRGGFRKLAMLPITIGSVVLLAGHPDFADGIVTRLGLTPGSVSRVASCALAMTAVMVISGRMVRFVRERFIMKRPLMRATDRLAGTGVGLVEGALLVLMACWSAAALEPQAKRVLFSPSVAVDSPQYRLAEGVARLCTEADGTPLRAIVRDANPMFEVPAIRQLLDGASRGELDLSGLDEATQAKIRGLLESVDEETLREVAGKLQGK